VVRKDQIHAPGVDVQGFHPKTGADLVQRHRRALEVPAGPAAAEGRVPRGAHLFVFRRRLLPQGKVPRVLLGVFVARHTRPDPERAAIELREAAIPGKLGDGEIHRAVVAPVGEIALQEAADERDHRLDVLGGPRVDVRPPDPEVFAILVKGVDVLLDVLAERSTARARRGDRAVVHVGQVHDVEDLVVQRLEIAPQEIFEEKGPKIPDVGEVPYRGPAGVHRHPRGGERREGLDRPRQRVVERERHGRQT